MMPPTKFLLVIEYTIARKQQRCVLTKRQKIIGITSVNYNTLNAEVVASLK